MVTRDVGAVLLIETTDTVLAAILDELPIPYDSFLGTDFSTIDLTIYDHMFVGMDGRLVAEPSVANAGGCLHFYGGTNYMPYANALSQYLLANDTANHGWTISAMPHVTVTDPGHYLAVGMPAT